MSQVKIGPKFFANELRVYRDWATAFWRENLQNSFDAKADRIDITIADGSSEDTKTVVVSDNGCGMDRPCLEDVYFTLGETTKEGNSVGGFGKARILTCFAQKQYTLRTNKLFVTGEGAEYEIEETETRVRGVRLEIEVFHKGRDLEATLRDYLKYCHLEGCHVTVNGKRWDTWTYKNKFERDLSFGKVFTNKSKDAGILVRVNGVHMFKPYTSAPFLVIVEIDKERSREVLQASRDGLLVEFHSELESFINELNINKQSALRSKKSKSISYKGTGTFTSRRSAKPSKEQQINALEALFRHNEIEMPDKIREVVEKAKDTEHAVEAVKELYRTNNCPLKEPEVVRTEGPLHNHGHVDEEESTEDLTFDMFDTIVVDDTNNSRVRKVIETYYPQNWDLVGNGWRWNKARTEKQYFRAGVEKYKLLVMWKAACEFAIRLLQDELQRGDDEISWGVGWCFSDEAEAKHKSDGGTDWLLLNPCKADGTMALGLSDKESLSRMVALACHEVCHILYTDHDEAFANLCNDLQDKAWLYKTEITKHIQACKDDAIAALDRIAA